MLAPLAGVAPRLVRELYDLCRDQKLFEARKSQEQIAALRQALKPGGVASLKAAMRAMGRDCGEPRPPVLALDAVAYQKLVGRARERRGATRRSTRVVTARGSRDQRGSGAGRCGRMTCAICSAEVPGGKKPRYLPPRSIR